MRVLRILLALLLALVLGGAPVLAGQAKPLAAVAHDCKGKVNAACPCDDGPSGCVTEGCMTNCLGPAVHVGDAAGLQAPPSGRYERMGSAPMRQRHPHTDPPVPRA
jgi:hypothetical protein